MRRAIVFPCFGLLAWIIDLIKYDDKLRYGDNNYRQKRIRAHALWRRIDDVIPCSISI